MQTETKKPLYKVLNEQRTQGTWQQRKNGTFGVMCVNEPDGHICEYSVLTVNTSFRNQATIKANFDYTALAVNNLHILAAALEAIDKDLDRVEDRLPATLNLSRSLIKEALDAIS